MYTLIRENVERVVTCDSERDRLIADGFSVLNVKQSTQTTQNHSISLEDMAVEELRSYAEKNGIDLGKSTSHTGILEKIKASLG